MVRDPNRRRFPLADRYIEVVDDKLTGEVLLDEALKMMKVSERMSVGTWIDLMSGKFSLAPLYGFHSHYVTRTTRRRTLTSRFQFSSHSLNFPLSLSPSLLTFDPTFYLGETWNVMKIGYQLKQVRERLAKGLVDKGVLRTEKRNFLLFDMATHPVSDPTFKDDVLRRTLSLLTTRSTAVPTTNMYGEDVRYRTIRAVSMVCAAFAANVLENALVHLSYDQRETAFSKCDELLAEFSQWPFGGGVGGGGGMGSQPQSTSSRNGSGGSGGGGIGTGGNTERMESANLAEIQRLARNELNGIKEGSKGSKTGGGGDERQGSADRQQMRELHLEVVSAVLEVYRRMDSLL